MSTQTLSEFFREKRAHAGSPDINWEARKSAWIASVDRLYETIVDMLKGPIEAGSVAVDYRSKTITEEFMGSYWINELALVVGDETVVFSPKARNVVGGSGRVDLRGDMGEVTLVAQPDHWAVVVQRTPTLKVVRLDQASLLDALRTVMRP
jgi:hypothetical protein